MGANRDFIVDSVYLVNAEIYTQMGNGVVQSGKLSVFFSCCSLWKYVGPHLSFITLLFFLHWQIKTKYF